MVESHSLNTGALTVTLVKAKQSFSLAFWPMTMDHKEGSVVQERPYDDAPSNQVCLRKDQQYRTCSRINLATIMF